MIHSGDHMDKNIGDDDTAWQLLVIFNLFLSSFILLFSHKYLFVAQCDELWVTIFGSKEANI
jgi:hypothetical protein